MMTLYGLKVPKGGLQTCRYGDGTGDESKVSLGVAAFVSGRATFEVLPREYKSPTMHAKVRYASQPCVWMAPTRAVFTGLGIENEGLELPLKELQPWEESKIKLFPVLWKNAVTGNLHSQVHLCGAKELVVDPLPEGADRKGALYPDAAHISDLKEVRDILYKAQRLAIAPQFVYPHDWQENDFVLCYNRGFTLLLARSVLSKSGSSVNATQLRRMNPRVPPRET